MNVTVIGAGSMGSALVKQLARAGHQVRVTARNSEKAQAVAAANPGVTAVRPGDAAAQAEVIILATGYEILDPGRKGLLGYGRYPNVISGPQMDRLLAPTRPTTVQALRFRIVKDVP